MGLDDEEFLGKKLDDLKRNSASLPPYAKKDLEENIEKYERLIRRMAQKYIRNRVEYDDLIQEAFIGLILADRDFDPSRSTDFHTYAIYRMKGKMYEYCIGNESPIYVPTHISKAASYIKQMQNLLGKCPVFHDDHSLLLEVVLTKEHPEEEKLSESTKYQLSELKRKLGNIAKNSDSSYERLAEMAHQSISSMVSDEVLGKIPKENTEVEIELGNKQTARKLRELLGEKKFTVLWLRYQGWNFREIAEKLKDLGYTNREGSCVSRQAVKAIFDETLESIRKLNT